MSLLVVGATALAVGNGVLPQTLREDAQQRGCSEIGDFYDRPGRIDPAYVFGYLDSKVDQFGEKSAVYWCQRPTGAERYLLVVWLSDSALASTFRCARTIAWRNYPGGLRVSRQERLALSGFWDREDPKRHGPSDAVPTDRSSRASTTGSDRASSATLASGWFSNCIDTGSATGMLPNKRLKLAGGDRLEGSGVLCPGGHGLTSTTLALAGESPAA